MQIASFKDGMQLTPYELKHVSKKLGNESAETFVNLLTTIDKVMRYQLTLSDKCLYTKKDYNHFVCELSGELTILHKLLFELINDVSCNYIQNKAKKYFSMTNDDKAANINSLLVDYKNMIKYIINL